ncbi:DUF4394 domain-containing protein [Nocardioides ginkgobilobae]
MTAPSRPATRPSAAATRTRRRSGAGLRTAGVATAAVLGLSLLVPGSQATSDTSAPTRAYGLTLSGLLVSFPLDRPERVERVGPVDGLVLDANLVGMDFRPADRRLYGVGNAGGIYVVDTTDGSVSLAGRLTVLLEGDSFGVDVNPAADALRIVGDTGQNLRYSFATGTTSTDTDLDSDGDPMTITRGIAGAAYVNNDTDPATGTALLDLDAEVSALVLQVPANDGTITALGPLGPSLQGRDHGFDIATRLRDGRAVRNTGYVVSKVDRRWRLLRVDLLTGRAREVGAFPGRTRVVDVAVVPAR